MLVYLARPKGRRNAAMADPLGAQRRTRMVAAVRGLSAGAEPRSRRRVTLLVTPMAMLALVGACKCSSGATSERSSPPAAAPSPHRALAALQADPWNEVDDDALREIIAAAQKTAAAEGKQVLLEFLAPWCADCREVVRLMQQAAPRQALAERYVLVPVNVGRFDRHRRLIERYGVRSIATLVIVDAEGRALHKSTLEPISGDRGLTAAGIARWLSHPAG